MFVVIFSRGYPSSKAKMNGIFELDQAKAIAKAGHKVIFASIDLRSIRRWRKWGFESKKVDGVDIVGLNIPLGKVPTFVLYKFYQWGTKLVYNKVLKKHGNPDIVHSHFTRIGQAIGKNKDIFDCPTVMTEHWSELLVEPINPTVFKYAKYAYENSDKVITVSSNLKKVIKEKFNIDSTFIPNAVDTNMFTSIENPNNDKFTFISISRLIPLKRTDLLIDAFAQTFLDKNNVQLLIYGDGPERSNLEKIILKYNISNQVKLMGFCDRIIIAQQLAKSHCFALVSQYETFGVAYTEALSAGVPVIATDCGGPSEFVNSSNGIMIPIDSLEDLKVALVKMHQTSENYNRNKISQEIKDKYSSEVVAQQITKVYQDVINDQQR